MFVSEGEDKKNKILHKTKSINLKKHLITRVKFIVRANHYPILSSSHCLLVQIAITLLVVRKNILR